MASHWKLCQVRLRLESPLHVGFRRYGNLAQTRRFAPARLFWGAITARYARDVLKGDYREAANWINQNVRLSYFFPGGEDGPDFPWTDDAFEWKYLHSHVSTALADGRSKADGSLHETEFIAPVTRAGAAVWLHGHLWHNAELNANALAQLRQALGRCQFGSERAYGWGRVGAKPLMKEAPRDLAVGSWTFRHTHPQVEGSGPLLAHTLAMGTLPAEPFVGRASSEKGFGSQLELLALAHAPGEVVYQTCRFAIGEFGFWQPIPA